LNGEALPKPSTVSTHTPDQGLKRLSFPALIATAVAGLLTLATCGQDDGQHYRMIGAEALGLPLDHVHSWVDRSPDGRTLLVSAAKRSPLLVLDATDLSVQRRIDIGDWNVGARVYHSVRGNYALLEEIEYLAYSSNGKDNARRFAVLNVATGQLVVNEVQAYSAALSADERTLYSIDAEGVLATDLATGKQNKVKGLERKGSAMALSPDGTRIAIAYDPTEDELSLIPSVRNDKKAIKAALKVGQIVLVHDLVSGKFILPVNELFDKVFRLAYNSDGKELWIHAKPRAHKNANPDVTLSYLDIADALTGEMGRSSYPSHALYEPTFCGDAANRLVSIGSQKGRYLEVHIYEHGAMSMVGRFVIDERLFKNKQNGAEKWSDARVGFALLPDGKRMLMTFGSRLIEWTYAP
jgi:hypothetical protein